jgi:aminoglycoside phosphotransferase (APT) family kinase protein
LSRHTSSGELGGGGSREELDPAGDIVSTSAEAARALREPLLILEPLCQYLDQHEIGAGPLVAEPLGDGHSNATYLLRRGDARVVLRRPPRGPLPPSTHDVVREARVMQAMERVGVPTPRVLAVCESPIVLGAPFYVMEYVAGHVLGAELPQELDAAGAGERIAFEAVDALVQIHTADWRASGMAASRSARSADRYLERQVQRFSGLWKRNATRSVPAIDRVTQWLLDNMPLTTRVAAVHGDFRLGNVMFDLEGPPRLIAVLDWEMATIGDPLADLGYLLATYARPDDEPNPMLALSAVTLLESFPSRDRLRQRYEQTSGLEVPNVTYYEVLALWKSAIFLEGSWRRLQSGLTDDAWFATLEDGVPALARLAHAQATNGGSLSSGH